MAWPLRSPLVAAALSLALAVPSAMAQAPGAERTPPVKPEPARPERSIAGLPLYTSDGKAIGRVIAMGLDDDDEPVLVAEIERELGFGPTAIAVPRDMFVRNGDRIELTITEAEVTAKLRQ